MTSQVVDGSLFHRGCDGPEWAPVAVEAPDEGKQHVDTAIREHEDEILDVLEYTFCNETHEVNDVVDGILRGVLNVVDRVSDGSRPELVAAQCVGVDDHRQAVTDRALP